jgi:predicted nuclease of predicted toxin-antitoxin system
MRFLVDAQLPPALARWLVGRGFEAEHVADCEMQAASDAEIWDYAVRVGAVIITKDEDFAQRTVLNGVGPTIIWLRAPNMRKRLLLAWWEQLLPSVLLALERGETLIEVV